NFLSRVFRGGHTQSLKAAARIRLILDLGVLLTDGRERGADFIHVHFLREAEGSAVATEEIHAEQFVAAYNAAKNDRDDGEDACRDAQRRGCLHEIDFGASDN